ncbi:FeoA family protein [Pyramidobacter piscolens]|jgi:Fe2+ transport system protein FeoA|uniref:FeoA family protein n=1 Tax=Pyramidobacter piscolens TaxID=638849 RepID=UPI0028E67E9B|nr:FeoA family protein [Pyramidobacter piscolens]
MFPLSLAPLNVDLKIVNPGGDARMSKRLESLGLGEGSTLTILQERDGDVIVRPAGGASSLALDQNVAARLMVTVNDS